MSPSQDYTHSLKCSCCPQHSVIGQGIGCKLGLNLTSTCQPGIADMKLHLWWKRILVDKVREGARLLDK